MNKRDLKARINQLEKDLEALYEQESHIVSSIHAIEFQIGQIELELKKL